MPYSLFHSQGLGRMGITKLPAWVQTSISASPMPAIGLRDPQTVLKDKVAWLDTGVRYLSRCLCRFAFDMRTRKISTMCLERFQEVFAGLDGLHYGGAKHARRVEVSPVNTHIYISMGSLNINIMHKQINKFTYM